MGSEIQVKDHWSWMFLFLVCVAFAIGATQVLRYVIETWPNIMFYYADENYYHAGEQVYGNQIGEQTYGPG